MWQLAANKWYPKPVHRISGPKGRFPGGTKTKRVEEQEEPIKGEEELPVR